MTPDELERILDVPVCLWFGLPPCPRCGREHGDPNCSPDADRRARERYRLASIYARPPERVTIAGRDWIFWLDDNRVDAFSLTDDDGIPVRGNVLYGWSGALRSGSDVAQTVLDFVGVWYGGVADEPAPPRKNGDQ